jgi:hypothetical protein
VAQQQAVRYRERTRPRTRPASRRAEGAQPVAPSAAPSAHAAPGTAKTGQDLAEAKAKAEPARPSWPPTFPGLETPAFLQNVAGDFPPESLRAAELRRWASTYATAEGPGLGLVPMVGDVE